MTLLLFIDTETTGVDKYKARCVELAAILWDTAQGLLEEYSTLIHPEGWAIPPQAEAIHGITQEEALRAGVPIREALTALEALCQRARPGRLIGHNLPYDVGILTSEYVRSQWPSYPLNWLMPFCTMQAMTPRCQLPGRYPGKPKWPRLSEAYIHCFNQLPDPDAFGSEHRALADARVCQAIYFHGHTQGWWTHD